MLSPFISGSQRCLEHLFPRQSLGFEREDEMDSVCVWNLECIPSSNSVDSLGPRLWGMAGIYSEVAVCGQMQTLMMSFFKGEVS